MCINKIHVVTQSQCLVKCKHICGQSSSLCASSYSDGVNTYHGKHLEVADVIYAFRLPFLQKVLKR